MIRTWVAATSLYIGKPRVTPNLPQLTSTSSRLFGISSFDRTERTVSPALAASFGAASVTRHQRRRACAAVRTRAAPPQPEHGCSRRSAPREALGSVVGSSGLTQYRSSPASPRPRTPRRNGRGLSRAVDVGHGDALLHMSVLKRVGSCAIIIERATLI